VICLVHLLRLATNLLPSPNFCKMSFSRQLSISLHSCFSVHPLIVVCVCGWCQAELRSALIELGEVEHAMEDVMGLLQQVEADLQQFGDVYGDPRHIEVHLRKIQANNLCCLPSSFVCLCRVQTKLLVIHVNSETSYLLCARLSWLLVSF